MVVFCTVACPGRALLERPRALSSALERPRAPSSALARRRAGTIALPHARTRASACGSASGGPSVGVGPPSLLARVRSTAVARSSARALERPRVPSSALERRRTSTTALPRACACERARERVQEREPERRGGAPSDTSSGGEHRWRAARSSCLSALERPRAPSSALERPRASNARRRAGPIALPHARARAHVRVRASACRSASASPREREEREHIVTS